MSGKLGYIMFPLYSIVVYRLCHILCLTFAIKPHYKLLSKASSVHRGNQRFTHKIVVLLLMITCHVLQNISCSTKVQNNEPSFIQFEYRFDSCLPQHCSCEHCYHNYLYVTITKQVFNNIDAESYVKPFRKCTQDTITE